MKLFLTSGGQCKRQRLCRSLGFLALTLLGILVAVKPAQSKGEMYYPGVSCWLSTIVGGYSTLRSRYDATGSWSNWQEFIVMAPPKSTNALKPGSLR